MKFEPPEFLTRYGQHRKVTLSCRDEGLTQQQFKNECDINLIINRYLRTGQLDHVSASEPYYADVSEIGDYRDALSVVKKAESAFMELPALFRKELDNDPQNFLAWLSDPANQDKAVKLGFLERPVAPKQSPVDEQQSTKVEN